MHTISLCLADIKTRWLREAPRAIAEIVRTHPDEEIYAAAFHLFNADYTAILPPALAANAESAVVVHSDNPGTTWDTRWFPADWRWSVLGAASDALKAHYRELSDGLHGATDAAWRDALEMHDEFIAEVARATTAMARNRDGDFRDVMLSENFVVAILDGQREVSGYNRAVRTSISPYILPDLEGILFETRDLDK